MPAVSVQQAFDLALKHHQAGRLAEAEAAYRQILAVQQTHADSLHLLGVIAHQIGQNDIAIELIRQAIASRPNFPEAHSNLGVALKDKGQLDEAIAAFRQAIHLNPNCAEAHSNLGDVLREKGELDESIAACRQAIALKRNYPMAYRNLGIVLRDQGRLDEAIAAHHQAIALEPSSPESYNDLGTALQAKGQLDHAIAAFRQAVAISAESPEPHHNLALALLVQGVFLEGWREYEWRRKLKEGNQRNFTQPQWEGGALEGRTLLLHGEQGFGDAIQFIRYVGPAAQCGGNIIIECQPELQRLFQTMAPHLPVVAKGRALPAFDVHCPLLSLPRLFSTALGNIPGTVPYLHADSANAAIWHERFAGPGFALKVGLVWAGGPTHKNDRNRSLKLAALAPFAEVTGVRFYSLQKGNAAAEVKTSPMGLELMDVAEELSDFTDTAALIANLDLVISVDTAVAHLAGAMGKPIWTLLPFAADWRWLLDRSDSPWYPTMRLFRQPIWGDWNSVIHRVAEELKVLVHSGHSQY